MSIEGAILDFDGTLIDSLDAWRSIESELAGLARTTVTPEDRAQLTTFTLDETARWFHDRFGLGANAAEVRAMIDEHMVAHLGRSAQVLPGVEAFLESCAQAGIKMVVASSSPQLYLRTALKATGLLPYFLAITSVEDVGHSKREPYLYDHARALMATPKEATWGFDDSIYALDALRAAGYPTVGIFDESERVPIEGWSDHADMVVRSFEELSLDRFSSEIE